MGGLCRRNESGFTLVEILVAVAILLVGLVAVMQWFPMGTQGMETGRRQSTAVFLAEQKVEQIKAWALSAAAGQGFTTVAAAGTCFTAANGPCRNDNFGAVPGYPEYSRTVIVAAGPTATTTLVRVQVAYRRVGVGGTFTGGSQVEVATMITQH